MNMVMTKRTRPEAASPSRERPLTVQLGAGTPPVRRVATSLARRFYQICIAISAESVADAGLTPLQYSVLSHLNKRNGEPGIDQIGLAGRLGIDRNSVGQLVEQLQKQGLLERRVNGADRRARVLQLTPKGEQLHTRLRPKNIAANERILGPLTPSERELLLDVLVRVIKEHAAYARPGAGRRKRSTRSTGGAAAHASGVGR
jgi:DNA-binding MarR family transcriptional regulator